MKKQIYLFLVLFSILMYSQAWAFDCKKAFLPVDFVICNNPDVMQANEIQEKEYFATRARLDNAQKKSLLDDQRNWIKSYPLKCRISNKGNPPTVITPESHKCVINELSSRTEFLKNYTNSKNHDSDKKILIPKNFQEYQNCIESILKSQHPGFYGVGGRGLDDKTIYEECGEPLEKNKSGYKLFQEYCDGSYEVLQECSKIEKSECHEGIDALSMASLGWVNSSNKVFNADNFDKLCKQVCRSEVETLNRKVFGQMMCGEELDESVKITSLQISQEYDKNEARGDAMYKGKILQITGVITSIKKDLFNSTIIALNGISRFSDVQAEVQKSEEQKAIELNKGMQIELKCKGSGEVMSTPILKECIILKSY